MKKVLSHHRDTEAMTRGLLAWIADPAAIDCTGIHFSSNCTLEEEASRALVNSPLAQSITRLEFTEVYFSPDQLAELLSMPALVELRIWGGESYDWSGPKYVYDTLENEHIEVLATSPHAQRLRVLEIYNQGFSARLGEDLRRDLPNLTTLRVENQSY